MRGHLDHVVEQLRRIQEGSLRSQRHQWWTEVIFSILLLYHLFSFSSGETHTTETCLLCHRVVGGACSQDPLHQKRFQELRKRIPPRGPLIEEVEDRFNELVRNDDFVKRQTPEYQVDVLIPEAAVLMVAAVEGFDIDRAREVMWSEGGLVAVKLLLR